MHDAGGRVAIPGFYDRVRALTSAERRYMADVGPSDREILADAGAADGWGEDGYTLYERTTIRPALTINGVTGGYQGTGAKAVIPARASAKLNFRLVADQDPAEIDGLFRRFLARITPRIACASRCARKCARTPVTIDRAHPAMRAAAIAYGAGFEHAPVFLRSGGTIPVIHLSPATPGRADRVDGVRVARQRPRTRRTRSSICQPSFEAFARASGS